MLIQRETNEVAHKVQNWFQLGSYFLSLRLCLAFVLVIWRSGHKRTESAPKVASYYLSLRAESNTRRRTRRRCRCVVIEEKLDSDDVIYVFEKFDFIADVRTKLRDILHKTTRFSTRRNYSCHCAFQLSASRHRKYTFTVLNNININNNNDCYHYYYNYCYYIVFRGS